MNGTFRFPVVFMPADRPQPPPHQPKKRQEWTLETQGRVYFIRQGLRFDGPIKVGWARNPEQRLRELQVGNTNELVMLGSFTGTPKDERRVHDLFWEDEIRGEWFEYSEALASLAEGRVRLEEFRFDDEPERK